MEGRAGRRALLGAEVEVLDLIFQVSTSEEWAELLKGPLERTAGQGNRGLAQKLVAAGARIGNALHAAVQGGHGEVVNDLLENGASIKAQDATYGSTPLHVAAGMGKPEMVQLLMLKGADTDAKDNKGSTPLYAATCFGHIVVAQALMAGGADVCVQYGPLGLSVVHTAAREGHVDILRAAINKGADVDAGNANKFTALHYAAIHDKPEAIDVLVQAGAKIESRNNYGAASLHSAAIRLNRKAVASLLKHGAHVNAQAQDLRTPLHDAVARAGTEGAAEVVDLLLRSGADENIFDNNGKAVADVLAAWAEGDMLAEDIERVRKLLENAPADRAWRRRGYLVLCRAHLDRVQQTPESHSVHADVGGMVGSGAQVARREEAPRCRGIVGSSAEDERIGGKWTDAMARVLGLQVEGIFRTIVGYL